MAVKKWLSSIKTSLSPKAWLAKRIAQVLNEFFVLDDGEQQEVTKIESNLLSDTKIVIRRAKVRPRCIQQSSIWLHGDVEEVEFAWTWTKSAKKNFVKNAKLSISGAHFRVVIGEQHDETENISPACNSKPQFSIASDSGGADNQDGYVQRQIQQILEHIQICISDVTLVVEEERNGASDRYCGLLVQAKKFQLLSLGRDSSTEDKPKKRSSGLRGSITKAMTKKNPKRKSSTASSVSSSTSSSQSFKPLTQQLILEGISVRVLVEPGKHSELDSLPLLDPIGYEASVTRVAGRRFLDSWTTGLNVVGEVLRSEETEGGLALHAGTTQVSTVVHLADRLSSILSSQADNNGPNKLPRRRFDGKFVADPSSNTDTEMPMTMILLPLPSICIVLPKGTTIGIPEASFAFYADGSVFHLRGSDGVWIDETPFLLLGGGRQAEWMVEFAAQKVSLMDGSGKTTHPSQLVAQIHWEDSIMKRVVSEVRLLAEVALTNDGESSAVQVQGKEATSSSSSEWLFECTSAIQVNVSCNKQGLRTKFLSPSVRIATGGQGRPRISNFALSGVDIGPTTNGDKKSTKLHIPALKLEEGLQEGQWAPCLTVAGSISGVLESLDVARKLMSLAETLVDFRESGRNPQKPPAPSRSNPTEPTIYVRIPRATMKIGSMNCEMLAENIVARSPFNRVGCRRFTFDNARGISLAVCGVMASFRPNFCAKVNSIDALQGPGGINLERPVRHTTKVVHKEGKLMVELPEHSLVFDGAAGQKKRQRKRAQPQPWKVPFPVHYSCPAVQVRQGGLTTKVTSLMCHLVPFEEPTKRGAPLPSLAFQLVMQSAENKFVKLDTTSASWVLKTHDLSTIHQFNFSTEPAEVRTGPSSMDLSSVLEGDTAANADPVLLPNANIGSIVVCVRWKGPVVGTKRTTSNIPAFQGGPRTNSQDLISHYKKALVERVAATITDSKVLGPKVSELSAKTAGVVLVHSESFGRSVRDTIAAGKQTRNAQASAKYKFGDFARGTIDSMKKDAAKLMQNEKVELFAPFASAGQHHQWR